MPPSDETKQGFFVDKYATRKARRGQGKNPSLNGIEVRDSERIDNEGVEGVRF